MNARRIVLAFIGCLLLSIPVCAQPALDLKPGIDFFNAKQYSKAQEFFQKLSRRYPENAAVTYYTGRSYYQSRQIKKAVEFLEKAVQLDKQNAENRYLLGMAYASYVMEVGILKKLGVVRKMKNAWVTATSLDETHKKAQIAVIGFCLIAPGVVGGSQEEGTKHLAILKEIYPDEIFSVDGSLAEKKGQFLEAEEMFRQAADTNRTPENLFALANFLNRRKQYDEVMKLLEEYLNLDLSWDDPPKAYAHLMLGTILAEKEMIAEAKRELQLAEAGSNDRFLGELIQKKMEELNRSRGGAKGGS